jgi:long-subunit fatty acid transport protein
MKFRRVFSLLIVVLAFFAVSASAQDFYWNSASTRALALGGVYVPSNSDALGALTTNPAGLTYLSSPTLDLSMSTVFARGSFSDSVNSNAPMTTSPGVIPYGAFGMPIGKSRFSFGVGFAPDMVSVSDWRYVDAPGQGGVTYGMQENKSAILAGRAMVGLSYALSHKLSVGVTAGADYNSNTLQAPYIFQSQPALAGDKTLLDLHTYGTGWNMSAGAMFEPTKNLDFGVAWKSHTVIVTNGLASGNAYALFGDPPGNGGDGLCL